jgi:hypothetical protein
LRKHFGVGKRFLCNDVKKLADLLKDVGHASAAGAECRAPPNLAKRHRFHSIQLQSSVIAFSAMCVAALAFASSSIMAEQLFRSLVGDTAPVRATQQPEANLMKNPIKTASHFAVVAAAMLIPATFAEAGGSRGKKAKANGSSSSQMMRLGGPRSNNGRASSVRTFDSANTGYGEFGSVSFARGEQRFDGVSVRQRFLKQAQEGHGG